MIGARLDHPKIGRGKKETVWDVKSFKKEGIVLILTTEPAPLFYLFLTYRIFQQKAQNVIQ
tara:strand:- start:191 stop:373 length:183 start_codon:yes stop_codon:yes gene_type:complete